MLHLTKSLPMVVIVMLIISSLPIQAQSEDDLSLPQKPPTNHTPLQGQVPEYLTRILSTASQVTIVSLDPRSGSQQEGNYLVKWKVLGETLVTDKNTVRRAVDEFTGAVKRNSGTFSMCFDPRHALKFPAVEGPYDIIICFACSQARIYRDGRFIEIILISGSPGFYNDILKAADVPFDLETK